MQKLPLRDNTGLVCVVMGVSGCGKSTVGSLLAQRLGVEYLEGDDFHPPENVARMAAGIALTDADRAGWLDVLAARIRRAVDEGRGLVLSCSALRRVYRDKLRSGASETGPVQFVYLCGSYALLSDRMKARPGHYMPPSLLESQYQTLEPPTPDEGALTFDVQLSPQAIVDEVLLQLAVAH